MMRRPLRESYASDLYTVVCIFGDRDGIFVDTHTVKGGYKAYKAALELAAVMCDLADDDGSIDGPGKYSSTKEMGITELESWISENSEECQVIIHDVLNDEKTFDSLGK